MSIIPLMCPKCGGSLQVDDSLLIVTIVVIFMQNWRNIK